MAAKVAGTAFLAVLIPIYLHTYGPTNFLWFCDAALILTVAGMWLESPLLISMCAAAFASAMSLASGLWRQPSGDSRPGLTGYMFDRHLPLFTRGLSLFHGWLPLLLVWLLRRLHYDKRALWAWSGLAAGLALAGYIYAAPAGAHPANPNIPININYVYGFNDQQPQHWVNQNLYVILWLVVLFCLSPHPPGPAQNVHRAKTGGRPENSHLISLVTPRRRQWPDSHMLVGLHPMVPPGLPVQCGGRKRIAPPKPGVNRPNKLFIMKHNHDHGRSHDDGHGASPQLVPVRFEYTHPRPKPSVSRLVQPLAAGSQDAAFLRRGHWWKETPSPPAPMNTASWWTANGCPIPAATESVANPFGGRNSILHVARSPESAHLADAENLPLKNTNKQKTKI